MIGPDFSKTKKFDHGASEDFIVNSTVNKFYKIKQNKPPMFMKKLDRILESW